MICEYIRIRNIDGIKNIELLKKVGVNENTFNRYVAHTQSWLIMKSVMCFQANHRKYFEDPPFDNEIAF